MPKITRVDIPTHVMKLAALFKADNVAVEYQCVCGKTVILCCNELPDKLCKCWECL